MSIQNAMQAGVAGLKANAAAVGRISENIANSNTIGYKRSFTNMVTSVAGESKSVNAVSRSDMATAGSLVQSSSSTDMAIEGEGYFVVMKDPESDDASNFMLTRAGSFDEDENGYLVNDAGYYLAGFVYDDEGSLGGVDRNSFTMMEAINTNGVTMTARHLPRRRSAATCPPA